MAKVAENLTFEKMVDYLTGTSTMFYARRPSWPFTKVEDGGAAPTFPPSVTYWNVYRCIAMIDVDGVYISNNFYSFGYDMEKLVALLTEHNDTDEFAVGYDFTIDDRLAIDWEIIDAANEATLEVI